jgi:two-component system heavy metal sensor histidine kinase CusS
MPSRADFDLRRWPLAVRLTAFLVIAMGAILLAVAWLMDDQLERQLHEQDEVELAHAIATQSDIVRMMQSTPPSQAWPRVWVEHMQPRADMSIRILAPDGRVYTETPGMKAPQSAFAPVPGRRYIRWKPEGDTEARYVVTTGHVQVRPGEIWTIQAAEDLSERHGLLEVFHARLRIVMLGALAAALLAGWWLVRRGLAPLRTMSAEIDRVGIERLHARIGTHPWPSDLQSLADNFDAMLSRLEAAFEQLSRFSSDLAHEFRSPITNLVAAASVTLARERSSADYKETLQVMVAEGERLSRMVTSMLFLARADNARQALSMEPVSIESEFARLVDAFEAVAEERGIELSASGSGRLMADPILVRRALTNLVTNALAHTPRGGRIALEARQTAEGTSLSVRDSGTGIAAHHLPRIFDRFYRVDAARSSSESTGLGLALVKSIVELHGGRVHVESAPGQGAVFALEFPTR